MGLATFNKYRRVAEERGAKGLEQLAAPRETAPLNPGDEVHPFTSQIPEQPQPELPDHPDQQPQPGVVPQSQPYTLPPADLGDAPVPRGIQPNFPVRVNEEIAQAADERNVAEQTKEADLNTQKMGEEGDAIKAQEARMANVPEEGVPTAPVGAPAPTQTERDNATAEAKLAEGITEVTAPKESTPEPDAGAKPDVAPPVEEEDEQGETGSDAPKRASKRSRKTSDA